MFRLMAMMLMVILSGCFGSGGSGGNGSSSGTIPPSGCQDCVIKAVRVEGNYVSYPYVGDIWTTTWADDDNLYMVFGDGTGKNGCFPTLILDELDVFDTDYIEVSPGCYTTDNLQNEYCQVFDCSTCLPLCLYTPAGLVTLKGDVPDFSPCQGPDQCVTKHHVPYGDMRIHEHQDKPSGIISIMGRLYLHMHYPAGVPEYGYLAYSDNHGKDWTIVENSPWGKTSKFKVMMFINMGKDYSLRKDDFLYALGMTEEFKDNPLPQSIYLARVPITRYQLDGKEIDPVIDYDAYRYFAGWKSDGSLKWSKYETDAIALEGLSALSQSAVMYHPGTDRYIFFAGFAGNATGTEAGLEGVTDMIPVGAIYEARYPWGPWHKVGIIPAGFIAGLITKGTGPDFFYFTAAGGGPVTYNLNVGKIVLDLY